MLDYFKEASVSKSHRNMVELTGVASTAIRMTGVLATSFLGDLIRADIFSPEATSLAVDEAKVQRAKEKLMGEAREREEERMEADTIMIDSRIYRNTKVVWYGMRRQRNFSLWFKPKTTTQLLMVMVNICTTSPRRLTQNFLKMLVVMKKLWKSSHQKP